MSEMNQWKVIVENAIGDFQDRLASDSDQRYGEQEQGNHYLPDRPELQPGDTVTIDGLFGDDMGSGHGVFVAYSLDGSTAILNVDGNDSSYPVDAVNICYSDRQSDEFESTGNDGSLSPMSLPVEDKPKIEINIGETEEMNDIEQWMKIMDEGLEGVEDNIDDGERCDCKQYDCDDCFPVLEADLLAHLNDVIDEGCGDDEFDEVIDIDDEDEEDLVENPLIAGVARAAAGAAMGKVTDKFMGNTSDPEPASTSMSGDFVAGVDDGMAEEYVDEDDEFEDDYAEPRIGDDDSASEFDNIDSEFDDTDSEFDNMDSEFGDADVEVDASPDTSEQIAQIAYMQDMGMSNSPNHYDADRLTLMNPDMIQRIFDKVMGEFSEDADYAEFGEAGEVGITESADTDIVQIIKLLNE